ncbi:hypothetical protein [Mammaliicoccus sciuri]|nr:hypothetical protein [Mammaliicoccus sciuri]
MSNEQLREVCEEHGLDFYRLSSDVKDAMKDCYERGLDSFYETYEESL